MEIRKIIYTTNVIESLNSGIRKFTKAKSLFPDDQAAIKAVYLSIMNPEKVDHADQRLGHDHEPV